MNELKVNFENLAEEERAELFKLVEKANKPKSKAWKPKNGELYYSCSWNGNVYSYCWSNDFFDEKNYLIGNVFKTKEEAENAVERLKIRAELQRFADEHNDKPIDWKDTNQKKWRICFDYNEGTLKYNFFYWIKDCFQIYFSSEEIAKAAVQSVGEERIKKYLFEVE